MKKRHVQTHDSESYADEDWVSFIGSGGWSGEQVWRLIFLGVPVAEFVITP